MIPMPCQDDSYALSSRQVWAVSRFEIDCRIGGGHHIHHMHGGAVSALLSTCTDRIKYCRIHGTTSSREAHDSIGNGVHMAAPEAAPARKPNEHGAYRVAEQQLFLIFSFGFRPTARNRLQ